VILYLDSSSLVKIYIEEDHSDLVREWAGAAEAIATSRVAYPETLSAFARRREQGDLEPHDLEVLQETLDGDWPRFVLMPVKERRAGIFAVRYLLRGFDAIHLAAVSDLRATLPSDLIIFSSFDRKLVQAARAEGIPLLVPNEEILS
jgi:predicted nucleic acid-binding protein